jgi:hypothetical protein
MLDLGKTAVLLGSLSAMAMGWGSPGLAADAGFRIDNKVFVGDQKEPASESTTIFHDGAVYDYLRNPAEVLVFEKTQDRFVMLNTERRIRAELSTEKIMAFSTKLQHRLDEQKDPFLKFLARPAFEEQWNAEKETLTLRSTWVSYNVQTRAAPSADVAHRCRTFTDWYAQLCPILEPLARPPFPRLRVNALLDEKGLLPAEVSLTLSPKQGFWSKRINIRSEHQLIGELNAADLSRVTQTRRFLVMFNPVSVEQYRHATP